MLNYRIQEKEFVKRSFFEKKFPSTFFLVFLLALTGGLPIPFPPVFANDAKSDIEATLDLGYSVFLFGEFRDYFANDFNYTMHAARTFESGTIGPRRLGLALQFAPLVSDDVRKSSRLTMFTLSPELDQNVFTIAWFELWLHFAFDFVVWRIRNFLSDDFPSSDQGGYIGMSTGIRSTFRTSESWSVGVFFTARVPEFQIVNTFFETGMSIGRKI